MAGIGLGFEALGIAGKLAGVGKFFSGIPALLGRVPPQVWEGIVVVAYAVAIFLTHSRAVHEHDAALIAANNAQWQTKIDAETANITKNAGRLVVMANQLKEANDETNASIAVSAQSMRLRGPGKAVCPGSAPAPAPSSRTSPVQPNDAPVASVPPAGGQQLFALPLDDTFAWGADHDRLKARADAWDIWYANLVKDWPKLTQNWSSSTSAKH